MHAHARTHRSAKRTAQDRAAKPNGSITMSSSTDAWIFAFPTRTTEITREDYSNSCAEYAAAFLNGKAPSPSAFNIRRCLRQPGPTRGKLADAAGPGATEVHPRRFLAGRAGVKHDPANDADDHCF